MAKRHTKTNIKTETLPANGPPCTFLLDLPQFGARLKQLADDCGGSDELGRRLGVTGQFIYMLISGKRKPGPKILKAVGARRKVMIEIEVEAK